MAYFDWDRDATLPPARVYDAMGERHRHVLRVETETGYLVKYLVDAHGQVQVDEWGELVEVTRRVPAPVAVYFSKPVPRVAPKWF